MPRSFFTEFKLHLYFNWRRWRDEAGWCVVAVAAAGYTLVWFALLFPCLPALSLYHTFKFKRK